MSGRERNSLDFEFSSRGKQSSIAKNERKTRTEQRTGLTARLKNFFMTGIEEGSGNGKR